MPKANKAFWEDISTKCHTYGHWVNVVPPPLHPQRMGTGAFQWAFGVAVLGLITTEYEKQKVSYLSAVNPYQQQPQK